MKTTSLDAHAAGQPGGLYQSMGNTLLRSMLALAQSRDRTRQGEREMRREERAGRNDQYRQALQDAMQLGVAPSPERAGWLAPGDQDGIQAALAQHMERKRAQEIADIAAGRRAPSQSREAFYADGLNNPPTDLLGEGEWTPKVVPAHLQATWTARDQYESAQAAAAEEARINREYKMAMIDKMRQPVGGTTAGRSAKGGLSATDLKMLAQQAERYADAQGWTLYDYNDKGEPINRRVNPDVPDAYRKIMELEQSLGLPGTDELLQFHNRTNPPPEPGAPIPSTGLSDKPEYSPEMQEGIAALLARRAQRRGRQAPAAALNMADMASIYDEPTTPGMGPTGAASQQYTMDPRTAGIPQAQQGPVDTDSYLRTRADRQMLMSLLD